MPTVDPARRVTAHTGSCAQGCGTSWILRDTPAQVSTYSNLPSLPSISWKLERGHVWPTQGLPLHIVVLDLITSSALVDTKCH